MLGSVLSESEELIYGDVTRVGMQVLHYGNTRFGTNDCLCNAIKEVCYLCHSPKLGPARSMLIERLCYYRVCYYRFSTVIYISAAPGAAKACWGDIGEQDMAVRGQRLRAQG